MKSSLIVLLVCLFVTGGCWAQSPDEIAGKAAEQAGKEREALSHYIAALQGVSDGSADDQRLRETIIKLVRKLDPPPPLPDQVIVFEGRAEAAYKSAGSTEDLMDAAREYGKALRIAPWVASVYFNLGIVLEKAGRPTEAINNFKLYLLAVPNAQDATAVKKRIAGLEYNMEKARKGVEQTAAEERRKKAHEEAVLHVLSGTWFDTGSRTMKYSVSVSGTSIEISPTASYADSRWWPWPKKDKFAGSINGLRISGICQTDNTAWLNGSVVSRPMTGTISADGKRIHLEYTSFTAVSGTFPRAPVWGERQCSLDIER